MMHDQGTRQGWAASVRAWQVLAGATALLMLFGCASHPSGPHGPSCNTIESATKIIEHPIQRLTILKSVARRQNLSQHEQEYLVNAIFMPGGLSISADQADATVTLLRNPCCTPETREYVRKTVKHAYRMLGKDERRIIEELDRPRTTTRPTTQPAKKP